VASRILSVSRRLGDEWKCSIPLRDLVEPVRSVGPQTRVSEVKQSLELGDSISAVVVADKGTPLGLLMSHHLDRALSTPYGMSLYYGRSVEKLMDASPLVAEGSTPVEIVAKQAVGREKFKIYDCIIVTENGKLSGIVSVQKMLDTLACVQVEMAKGANPLTGLPGNVAIELELERRVRTRQPSSFVYVDLDNFKIYNDTYGFRNGDAIILLLARILSWAAKRHGGPKDEFIGHVGGDDFVIMSSPDRAERICRAVTRVFGRLIRLSYCAEDRQRGTIRGKDRHTGEERDFPLVTVSLAIIDCDGGCDPSDIARRSAEMKKYAKTFPGNAYVRDRRTTLAPLPAGR
jgi:diguanylate cyclase (GGDEF)-like protein